MMLKFLGTATPPKQMYLNDITRQKSRKTAELVEKIGSQGSERKQKPENNLIKAYRETLAE